MRPYEHRLVGNGKNGEFVGVRSGELGQNLTDKHGDRLTTDLHPIAY